ncbi:PTS system mannose/fructose/N-acetylgalactosamine-transporter subunit IIB [Lactococcus formosensis]|uniref:PTS system mannose/fructose/N-acetylgalactosamine-transporter subunit IIB n=1 Tax=Lactococcus formosensis TaxID=1281486 RepID=UPI001BCB9474|nr:PTS sugar transporter subunit IIB [Lactococcus formosensis]
MIIHARVDERLIHGQVAAVWLNVVNAERLYVANDSAWKDDMVLGALQLAKPAGKKLTVSSVRRAIVNFKENRFGDERVFVLTKTIGDMKALVDAGVLDEFNVGNISKQGEDAVQIKKSVFLTPQDIAQLRELTEKGTKITARMVPGESDVSIMSMIDDK